MRILKVVNAAIVATKERRFIARNSKKQLLNPADQVYLNALTHISGEPSKKFSQQMRNWYKAYQADLARQQLVEDLSKPFQKKGKIATFIERILK